MFIDRFTERDMRNESILCDPADDPLAWWPVHLLRLVVFLMSCSKDSTS